MGKILVVFIIVLLSNSSIYSQIKKTEQPATRKRRTCSAYFNLPPRDTSALPLIDSIYKQKDIFIGLDPNKVFEAIKPEFWLITGPSYNQGSNNHVKQVALYISNTIGIGLLLTLQKPIYINPDYLEGISMEKRTDVIRSYLQCAILTDLKELK